MNSKNVKCALQDARDRESILTIRFEIPSQHAILYKLKKILTKPVSDMSMNIKNIKEDSRGSEVAHLWSTDQMIFFQESQIMWDQLNFEMWESGDQLLSLDTEMKDSTERNSTLERRPSRARRFSNFRNSSSEKRLSRERIFQYQRKLTLDSSMEDMEEDWRSRIPVRRRGRITYSGSLNLSMADSFVKDLVA